MSLASRAEKYCSTAWSTAWRSSPGMHLVTGPLRLLGSASGGGAPVDTRRKIIVSYFLRLHQLKYSTVPQCAPQISLVEILLL